MTDLILTLTGMAHGGMALGRDKSGRPIFVPMGIPGERVRVRVPTDSGRFARAELLQVLEPSPDRVIPRCRHFGVCGNCHLQHMNYAAQLRAKEDVVRDQMERVGGLKKPPIQPIRPFPEAYGYRSETALFPAGDGTLGYWSPVEQRIIRIEMCPVLQPRLEESLADIDIDLPGLRKLVLRIGDEAELLAALEIDEVDPPELTVDYPVSVAIVLPDRTAASLIGDPFLPVTVGGRELRLSPGVEFPASAQAAALLIAAVLELAAPTSHETVLETSAGCGWLTAAMAGRAAQITVIEPNPDAVRDMIENLDEFDNIAVYEGSGEEVLPGLAAVPDVVVHHGNGELSPAVRKWLRRLHPPRLVCLAEVGTAAKDAKQLQKIGYRLQSAIPVDTRPQAYQIDVVSLWQPVKSVS